ncbi:DUF3306 domain-containing protein [Candidatus Accumulibacter phosphatis]|uniref:DUF3306 domain-containing protein n=1 Tax=Candidatus Accumulibacter phosphatis TaxID=327160 RepID=A0ABX1TYW1_9PROT|nr:DUF3306 domain-containing protein [Candidatus Accumulibacter phosphatis]
MTVSPDSRAQPAENEMEEVMREEIVADAEAEALRLAVCFARQAVAGNRWITQRGEPVAARAPLALEEIPLPDPATLSLADDFSVFLHAKVPEALKRQAMRQLFAQAHFNIVDGLDVCMEDFNALPDLPRDELALLRHAREVLDTTPQQALRPAQASAHDARPRTKTMARWSAPCRARPSALCKSKRPPTLRRQRNSQRRSPCRPKAVTK